MIDIDASKMLKEANLRPTKQRVSLVANIYKYGNRHVSAESLHKEILDTGDNVSLATVYNTVHAFKKKGYLKEISVNSEKSYFDTNTSKHHHFLDVTTNELIDLKKDDVDKIKINKNLPGKKIKSVEVLVKIENSN